MAIYFAGYLSPIRNKLGNAVGRKWRTLDVLSVYNGRPRNPRTTAQQINRTKFGAAASIARAFDYVLKIGFKPQCDGTPIPERSMFIKKNWNAFICDTPGAASVEYSELTLAEGTLPEAGFGNATFTNPQAVDVAMTDSSALPGALETDKIVLFVYSPEAGAGMLSEAKMRDDDAIAITVPDQWNGHRVHVWGMTYGAPNTDNAGKVANSRYLGSGTIQ
jgi:hypothetical protein